MTPQIPEQNREVALHTKLSMAVLDRIEQEKVAVSPRWQFLLAEYGIWMLWVLSIFIGAAAFSVTLFVLTFADSSFLEATHPNIFAFYGDVLPYMWIMVFILMALLANFNFRNTKHGYKYPVWLILGSSMLFSFIGGVGLHVVGVGHYVDMQAGKNIPSYPTLEKIETKMWQAPQLGRMVGRFVEGSESNSLMGFVDFKGQEWTLATVELNEMDLRLLHTGEPVRLLGIPSTTTQAYFHGCGVFPWGFTKRGSQEELKEEREEFIARMREHHVAMLNLDIATSAPLIQKPVCATHAAVMRLLPQFKE